MKILIAAMTLVLSSCNRTARTVTVHAQNVGMALRNRAAFLEKVPTTQACKGVTVDRMGTSDSPLVVDFDDTTWEFHDKDFKHDAAGSLETEYNVPVVGDRTMQDICTAIKQEGGIVE